MVSNEHFNFMLFIRKNLETSPQYRHSQVTEINTLDQITGKGNWREPHTRSIEGFDRGEVWIQMWKLLKQ